VSPNVQTSIFHSDSAADLIFVKAECSPRLAIPCHLIASACSGKELGDGESSMMVLKVS
jgi:hypothetical protein